mmetsp:Transcript_42624/g.77437  ORF Transcript_42624/g.77437 Transcript_42624/m.77437 type:complete len:123 (-) Transcript_42624:624-992(-)
MQLTARQLSAREQQPPRETCFVALTDELRRSSCATQGMWHHGARGPLFWESVAVSTEVLLLGVGGAADALYNPGCSSHVAVANATAALLTVPRTGSQPSSGEAHPHPRIRSLPFVEPAPQDR